MVCRTAIALAALVMSVPPLSAEEESLVSLRLNSLPSGQNLRVRTAQREYRIQLLDQQTGEALVAGSLDGRHFSPAEKMFIIGATHGRQPGDGGFSLVLMGELHEGMRIEWGRKSMAPENRGVTSPVESISLVGSENQQAVAPIR